MTRKLLILVTMLIALGTMGIRVKPASAADTHVPFKASYAGAVVFTGPGTAAFNGTGTGTYLGLSANQGLAIATGPDSACPGGLANVNTETLTAANGDSLTITSDDVGCPTSPFVFYGTGHWTVTAGTGRFSGATGQGTLNGYSDFNDSTFAIQLTGMISAPH